MRLCNLAVFLIPRILYKKTFIVKRVCHGQSTIFKKLFRRIGSLICSDLAESTVKSACNSRKQWHNLSNKDELHKMQGTPYTVR
jgi:hypothetical protein